VRKIYKFGSLIGCMKKTLKGILSPKNVILSALVYTALSVGNYACKVLNPERTPLYEYAISKRINPKTAKRLDERLSPELEDNYENFINAISSYSPESQELCIQSDILDNKHISDAELKNVREKILDKTRTEIENPREIYAVLANSSGPSQSERFSKKNLVYSALDIISFYELLKKNGTSDENISLLMYNPLDLNFLDTPEYKSLLKEKRFQKILPLEDCLQIDGEATKDNFLSAIKDLNSDSNDRCYIVLSDSSPKKVKEGDLEIMYGKRNTFLELDKKIVFSRDVADVIKGSEYEKMIMFLNGGEARGFFPSMGINAISQSLLLSDSEKREAGLKNILAIDSAGETFLMNFINQYLKDKEQSIEGILEELKKSSLTSNAYHFKGREKSAEECPWFYSPFMDN